MLVDDSSWGGPYLVVDTGNWWLASMSDLTPCGDGNHWRIGIPDRLSRQGGQGQSSLERPWRRRSDYEKDLRITMLRATINRTSTLSVRRLVYDVAD